MIIHKEIKGHELYLYMNGKLIYKRWLDTGQSKVFDIMAYDKYTLSSYKALKYEDPYKLITVRARIKMKTIEEGGRKTGFINGYRPNHVFEYAKPNEILNSYIGDISFEGQSTIEPGEQKEVVIRFIAAQKNIEQYLNVGRVWWIHEGSRCLGEGEILEIIE